MPPPITRSPAHDGVAERFSTIEKARHWLRRKWPVLDDARQAALEKVESAMDCRSPVEEARSAFVAATDTSVTRRDRSGPHS